MKVSTNPQGVYKVCPICGLPNNSIWDYCLKCEKELGFAKCQELEKIKNRLKEKK